MGGVPTEISGLKSSSKQASVFLKRLFSSGAVLLLHLAVVVAFTASSLVASSAEPQITDVFVAGKDGHETYRIPAIVTSTKGTVLAFCEERVNSDGDTGEIHLALKRSIDGGKTWSAQQVIWSDGKNTCGNPAPLVDHDTGIIWLLMTWNLGSDTEKQINLATGKNTRRVFVTFSKDEGLTWAKPREITADVKLPVWRWYATGPANGIQLTRGQHKGRLVVPANHTELSSDGAVVTRSHIIYSDDHGATWHLGGVLDKLTNESTLAERADASLLDNMRSYRKEHCRAVAISEDGGMTWSPVKPDRTLFEPVCQGSLFRCTWPEGGQKSRILFLNPASLKRENLTIRVTYDEGSTWPLSRTLHAGPAAYSGITLLPDGSIGCLYECGDRRPYEKIVFEHFSLDWLETRSNPPQD